MPVFLTENHTVNRMPVFLTKNHNVSRILFFSTEIASLFIYLIFSAENSIEIHVLKQYDQDATIRTFRLKRPQDVTNDVLSVKKTRLRLTM